MCQTLAELRRAAACLAGRFDPALLAPDQLAQALRDAGAIEKMMSSVASLTAARMAATGPTATAARQAVRELAHASGTSLFEANRALEAGKLLTSQPDVTAAALAGELSRQQLALVAGAVAVNAGAAPKLLALAKTGSLQELSDESARARAAHQDLEGRRKAIHLARSLRPYTDASGTGHLLAKGTPEEIAMVMACIRPFADKAFERARKEGRRERPEAYAFDGLIELATAGGTKAPKTEIIYRVDLPALLRGYPVDDEVCEIAGFGPVSAQAVVDLMDCGDPILKAVVTKGKDVVNVTHLGRRPNAHQQTALDWLFPTCAAEACGTRASYLETDHRLEWSKSHFTVLGLLDRLCRYHHHLKTYQGWALVHGRGKRAFVPPDDSRHPRHTHIEERR
ncbi:MAG TPA: hypothetical protein VMF65_24685 [Acidimicrobiales bacterium]|nr:hypothetical protein [Acidimicrobiales bacterium]